MHVEALPHNLELQALAHRLEAAGINYKAWESGRKNIQHLLQEIKAGETELLPDPTHKLVRQLRVLKVEVEYTDPQGQVWRLKELKQVWHTKKNPDNTPRVDVRSHVGWGLSEKISAQELTGDDQVTVEGIQRALSEELGIEEFLPATFAGHRQDFDDSPSYPGLKSKYLEYIYQVKLPSKLYKPEFVEKGEEKSTYFGWVQK